MIFFWAHNHIITSACFFNDISWLSFRPVALRQCNSIHSREFKTCRNTGPIRIWRFHKCFRMWVIITYSSGQDVIKGQMNNTCGSCSWAGIWSQLGSQNPWKNLDECASATCLSMLNMRRSPCSGYSGLWRDEENGEVKRRENSPNLWEQQT